MKVERHIGLYPFLEGCDGLARRYLGFLIWSSLSRRIFLLI